MYFQFAIGIPMHHNHTAPNPEDTAMFEAWKNLSKSERLGPGID